MVDDAIVIDNHTIGVEYKRSKELLLRWSVSAFNGIDFSLE